MHNYEYTGQGGLTTMRMTMHLEAPDSETLRVVIEPKEATTKGAKGAYIDLNRDEAIRLWIDIERLFVGG